MTVKQLWLALLMCGTARLESLRQEFQQRYNARAHELLGLTPAQAAKFDSTQSRAWAQRRDLILQRRRINLALQGQMRPGRPANADSVSRLLDSRRRVNESLRGVDDREDREMEGYLSPVQRAQYQTFRGNVREHMGEAMRHQPGVRGRPGQRQRPGAVPPRRRRP